MEKKGQITAYVILGIAIVALVALFLYARTNIFLINPNLDDLNDELEAIEEHIDECIEEVSEEPIVRIARQGGYLETAEDTFRLYADDTISYLCYNMENDPRCRTRILSLEDMENELTEFIDPMLRDCIDVQSFRKFGGFDIEQGAWNLNTEIQDDYVTINLDMPIVLKSRRSGVQVKQESFSRKMNYPLGDLYKASQNIIEAESTLGDFDQLAYMVAKRDYRIEKKRPYPDILYMLTRRDNPDYAFQFFIQGEVL